MLLSTVKAKNVCFLMRTTEVSCPLKFSKKHVVPHFALTPEEGRKCATERNTIVEYEPTWWQLGKNLLFQWEPNTDFSAEQNLNSKSSCIVFTTGILLVFHYMVFFAGTSRMRIFW